MASLTAGVHSRYPGRALTGARAWFLRDVIVRAGDLLLGQGLLQRLEFLENAQWWSPAQIAEYRDRRIAQLVRTAYEETGFYREAMERAHVHWSDIRGAADLPKLPIATKTMLRQSFPDRTVRPTGNRTYPIQTSGSTGQNFHLVEDYETAGMHRAAFLLALSWAGWRFGEAHLQTGIVGDRNLERRLKDRLLNCYYLHIRDLSQEAIDRALDALDRKDIRHLWGYPVALNLVARRAKEVQFRKVLKSVVTWGDMLYPHYRAAIEEAFGVRVLDTYGCSEGMQIAAQCEARRGYHIHEFDVAVECVDERGHPTSEGFPGNLIVTRLHPGPMPLIRYRIGDAGILAPYAGCSCGRHLKILDHLQGRETDVVITGSGNRLLVEFFTDPLDDIHEIDCYQIRQSQAGSIEILVTLTAGCVAHANFEEFIRERLAAHGAPDLDVKVRLVDHIPIAPSGKRRFVISEVACS